MESKKLVYLDHNATSFMSGDVVKEFIAWTNRGNPSSSYQSAKQARKMMFAMREYVGKICGIGVCCEEPRDGNADAISADINDSTKYKVIFTSCASESNCTVISAAVDAYTLQRGQRPHVISSTVEHKSIILQLRDYEARGRIDLTLVPVTTYGAVDPIAIKEAIKYNTCLITVMHANNETGAINDIAAIGAIAHSAGIPFHTDAVQTFARISVLPIEYNVDAISVSCHKFGGPPGVGLLIIKQAFLYGWKLPPMIYGTQNESLRGGTENLPGIGAAFKALTIAMNSRAMKAQRCGAIKKYIIKKISELLPTVSYTTYCTRITATKLALEIVMLSGGTDDYLYNTILLSIVKRGQPQMCNSKFKKELELRGVIVSIGSACNTANSRASHVLFAMGADDLIRKGALRISLGDTTTMTDAKIFIQAFMDVLKGGKWHAD